MYEHINKNIYDVIIVGGGIGGLLSAALFSEKGYSVIILERLSFVGGRFYSINKKGYEIPTGALHLIPNERGTFAEILNEFNISGEKVDGWGEWRWDGYTYISKSLFGTLKSVKSFSARKAMVKTLMKCLLPNKQTNMPFGEFIRQKIKNDEVYKYFETIVGFTLSLSIEDIQLSEMLAIYRQAFLLGQPFIPNKGCRGVVNGLMQIIKSNGGEIIKRAKVGEIIVEDSTAMGVDVNIEGDSIRINGKYIISDIGPIETLQKIKDKNIFKKQLNTLKKKKPASGITIVVGASKDMVGHTGTVFTPLAQRICGIMQPTLAEPSLAPKGKHMLLTHQVLRSGDIKKEIRLGIDDLYDIFPDFDKYCEILCIHVYQKSWPVNRLKQGEDISSKTDIRNLYLVGDGNKTSGRMMTEGIAHGVKNIVNEITK